MAIIIGVGTSGLSTFVCLNVLSIPNIILEREDCFTSLWKKMSYDSLKLHLGKQFCQLPHMAYLPGTPTFIPKAGFPQYLEDYVSHFKINLQYHRFIESASYDKVAGKWHIVAKNTLSDELEIYLGNFWWSPLVRTVRVSFLRYLGWTILEGISCIVAIIRMERDSLTKKFWLLDVGILA